MASIKSSSHDEAILRARSVFITGAASGIGFALVQEMLVMPSTIEHIFASYRSLDSESGKRLLDLSKTHTRLTLVEMDITCENSIKRAFETVQACLSNLGLHLLINNAGIGDHDTFLTATTKSMELFYKTNAIGPMLVAQDNNLLFISAVLAAWNSLPKTFLPLLKIGKETNYTKGRSFKAAVVNVSSQVASLSSPRTNYFSYGCSKVALNMITRCMSLELKREEIVVIPIHPGSVKTKSNEGGRMNPGDASLQILNVICNLQLNKTGKFLSYNGSQLPW
ncbi:uncharacterized protein TRIADDRAFT_60745 [Trichoplax adhaerens]|uniref:C-factor n=1 Tax=Trichoplax adhaerens TaxID=10228 RepID=B3S8U2_TRIAD|nr:hypothetical protein TRIADDRAFT_60745 [Trichoplax adhaerens]EDV20762.1 hypothetical protein TRIADDRAFT_60745 [Trichoplax adhaerens]|eukprot:XP_002116703.1 hypothetical protein TRIADDRAFT_60745 [Trichoplax adhaerens]